MPELVEIELYRRAAEPFVGSVIEAVEVVDPRFVRPAGSADDFAARLTSCTVTGVERRGKVLVMHTSGPTVGLRFGMTGVLVAGGHDTLDELVYGPSRHNPAWIRLRLDTTAGELAVRDPRILGSAQLDPDLGQLGPDALTITPAALRAALQGSRTALKARLMDQHRLAGVGNLIADEVLWRASLPPDMPAGAVSSIEVRRLCRQLRSTIGDLLDHGGSHRGRMTDQRRPGGMCPRCHVALRRSVVGGRTTWWCPAHQRRHGASPQER